MLAARKKKFQPARRMSRSMASPLECLITVQPGEYGSVSTRKDWGTSVPARIMTVPAFMVLDKSPPLGENAVGPARASAAMNLRPANTRRCRACSAVFF